MPAMPEPGTVLGGHRIVRLLGYGPNGAAYEAVVEASDERVVLKALREKEPLERELRDGITADLRALAGLRSHRIVTPRAAGEADGLFWLISPFREGNLAAFLETNGPFDRATAVAVCDELAVALGAAHRIGITHGGVKPSNVFLGSAADPVVQVADFGSRLRGVDWAGSPEVRLGQAGYAAPETLAHGVRDVRADVYSLGCVLYAALTGRTPLAVSTEVLGGSATVPEHDAVDADLNRLLTAMLHQDPRQRPEDMTAVRRSLASLGAAPVPVEKPAPEPASSKGRANPMEVAAAAMDGVGPASEGSRRGLLAALPRGARRAAAVGVALVVVLALFAWWLHRDNGPESSPTAAPTATATASPSQTRTQSASGGLRVTAQPAYRAVAFTVAAGGKATEVQRNGVWEKVTGKVVRVATSQGSEQACVQVRLAGGGTPVRSCGESRAPDVAMDPVGSCTIGTTTYTHCYELTLAGFKPGKVKVHSAAADAQGVMQNYTDEVTIDRTGRGRDQARFGTSTPSTVQISVEGIVKNLAIG